MNPTWQSRLVAGAMALSLVAAIGCAGLWEAARVGSAAIADCQAEEAGSAMAVIDAEHSGGANWLQLVFDAVKDIACLEPSIRKHLAEAHTAACDAADCSAAPLTQAEINRATFTLAVAKTAGQVVIPK